MKLISSRLDGGKYVRRDLFACQRIGNLIVTLAVLLSCLHLEMTMTKAQTKPSDSWFAPEVEIQKDDYGNVRKTFRTKLVRQVPSPQSEQMPKAPAEVKVIEYSSGGLRLKAWTNLPNNSGKKKYPAILFLHGGFAFGKEDWEMSEPYRNAGFIVLTPMLRGENGQAGSFTLFYDEINDVLAAAEYLSKQPSVDAQNIYVAGHSSGGTLALLASQASSRFRAAAAFDGSPDQQLLYKGKAAKPVTPKEVTFDLNDLRELQVRSPLAYAASFKCPTRLYYSTEASIYFHYANQRTVMAAKAKGLDVETIQVEGSHFSHVAPAMKHSIEFFKQSLSSTLSKLGYKAERFCQTFH